MEDKKIEVVRNWSEPKLVQDIQVFIGFVNFYWCFIRNFSRIAAPLTSLLKMTKLSDLAPRLGANDGEVVGSDGKADNRNLSKKSKNVRSGIKTCIKVMEEPIFLTSNAKKVFNQLRQVFTKAPILQHFDLEFDIWIETNASSYAIGGVLSQLTFDHLTSNQGQWHQMVYVSRKMIPVETQYKTYNAKLLAIIEAFKTWCHYLESCKYEVFVLTNYNNLWRFMDIKSLSSKQVH